MYAMSDSSSYCSTVLAQMDWEDVCTPSVGNSADVAPPPARQRQLPRGGHSLVLVFSGRCDLDVAFGLREGEALHLLNDSRRTARLEPYRLKPRPRPCDRVHGLAVLEWSVMWVVSVFSACPANTDLPMLPPTLVST